MMKATSQKRLRTLHSWFGLFFAPGVLFFAISGLLQTLGLHESGPGRQPAAPFIGVLASVHKEGEAVVPKRRAPPAPQPGNRPRPSEHDHAPTFSPFKIYVLLLSLALIASTGLGIAIALTNQISRRRNLGLLAIGCVVPLVLLLL
jgi:hypothetical protein